MRTARSRGWEPRRLMILTWVPRGRSATGTPRVGDEDLVRQHRFSFEVFSGSVSSTR